MRGVAEPEELEARIRQQRDVEDEHEAGGDPADHVRHQLAEDDARRRLPRGLRGEDEVAALQRQRLPAQDPGLERPEDEREDDGHRRHPAALQVPRGDDEERNRRDGDAALLARLHLPLLLDLDPRQSPSFLRWVSQPIRALSAHI